MIASKKRVRRTHYSALYKTFVMPNVVVGLDVLRKCSTNLLACLGWGYKALRIALEHDDRPFVCCILGVVSLMDQCFFDSFRMTSMNFLRAWRLLETYQI